MLHSEYYLVSVQSTLNNRKGALNMGSSQIETIIYGGAFNPPTKAHQAIVQACIDYAEPRSADVWLLPSASRRDKAIEVSRERRLELCDALLHDVMTRTVAVAVSTVELDRTVLTETYDTVRELEGHYPDRMFRWVFGADSVDSMASWNHGEWLVEHLPMLVVDRPGCSQVALGANAVRLAVDTGDVSSTEVRRRMHLGESYRELVGPRVAALL